MKITLREFQRFILLGLSFENRELCLPVVQRLALGLMGEIVFLSNGRTGSIMYLMCESNNLEGYQNWYDAGLPVMVYCDGASPCKLEDASPNTRVDWGLGPVWRFVRSLTNLMRSV